ncbi:MAG: DUF3574 domain-containing protein [Acidobacteriota bacterium]
MRFSSDRGSSHAAVQSVILAILLSLTFGCATAPQTAVCQRRGSTMVSDMLYFGTERPDGKVTPTEWQRFLEDVVTPLFPQGFTSWEAVGQWQGTGGRIVREPSYILQIVHENGLKQEEAIQSIISAYKEKFRQDSVMHLRALACTSF